MECMFSRDPSDVIESRLSNRARLHTVLVRRWAVLDTRLAASRKALKKSVHFVARKQEHYRILTRRAPLNPLSRPFTCLYVTLRACTDQQ